MTRFLVAFGLFIVLLIGCIGPPPPEDLSGIEVMTATDAYVGHSGAGSVIVVPEDSTGRPASCSIYRNNVSYMADSCEVHQGQPYPYDVDVAWHIEGLFKGSDAGADQTMQRVREKMIVAFDENREPVAWWDGLRYHETFQMAIE